MLKYQELTGRIIQAFYKVYNSLGYGFLEKVYHNALLIELKNRGMAVESKSPIRVYYEGQEVGVYFADILVDNTVILELKAMGTLGANEGKQLINYLKASHLEVGLLFNFGPKPEFQRRVFDHSTQMDEVEGF